MIPCYSQNHIRYFDNEHNSELDEENKEFATMQTIDESKEVEDEEKTINNIKSPPSQVLNKVDIFCLDDNLLNKENSETINKEDSVKLPRDTPTTPINDPNDSVKFSSNSQILFPSYPEIEIDSYIQDIIKTSNKNCEKEKSFKTEEISHSKSYLKITNIVFVSNLNCKINLAGACKLCDNCRYHPSKFSGMILEIRKPKATATIFPGGELVCLGTKSEEDSTKAAQKIESIIKNLGYTFESTGYRIVNIVASAYVGHKISLTRLSLFIEPPGIYDCDVFPGLYCKMEDPIVTIVIFSSGKFNIFGAKNNDDITKAYNWIIPQLRKSKKEEKSK